MKDISQDIRIQAWFNERPELLIKYPNHWVVFNVRRRGVSIAEMEQSELLKRMDKERNRLLDRGQAMDEVFVVHTSAFKGQAIIE